MRIDFLFVFELRINTNEIPINESKISSVTINVCILSFLVIIKQTKAIE